MERIKLIKVCALRYPSLSVRSLSAVLSTSRQDPDLARASRLTSDLSAHTKHPGLVMRLAEHSAPHLPSKELPAVVGHIHPPEVVKVLQMTVTCPQCPQWITVSSNSSRYYGSHLMRCHGLYFALNVKTSYLGPVYGGVRALSVTKN